MILNEMNVIIIPVSPVFTDQLRDKGKMLNVCYRIITRLKKPSGKSECITTAVKNYSVFSTIFFDNDSLPVRRNRHNWPL